MPPLREGQGEGVKIGRDLNGYIQVDLQINHSSHTTHPSFPSGPAIIIFAPSCAICRP